MLESMFVQVAREGLLLVLIVSLPPLLVSLLVGLMVSLFQATTQIQEQTLSYVPKILAVFLVLMALMPWMISQVTRFASGLLELVARGGQ